MGAKRPGTRNSGRVRAFGWSVLAAASVLLTVAAVTQDSFLDGVLMNQPGAEDRSSAMTAELEQARSEAAEARRTVAELAARLDRIEAAFGPFTGSIPEGPAADVVPESAPAALPLVPPMNEGEINDRLSQFAELEAVSEASTVQSTGFAITLASAATMTDAQKLWRALGERHPDLLGSLEPRLVVDEISGLLSLRVIAGPFRNAAEAQALCAKFRSTGQPCETTVFDGQRLAMQ